MQILNTCGAPPLHTHNLFSRPFFQPQSVYIRFTHIGNMQPKFYIGSAMHHTLDREYSRSRKYLQLTNERLVQAELALRYWQDHDNLYIWAPIPIYTDRTDYRSLEIALIQEWQPRLNFPFICHFSIQKRASSRNQPSTRMPSSAWLPYGVGPSTSSLRNLFAKS